MGLENLTTSFLRSANMASIDEEELIEEFDRIVNSPIMLVLFEIMQLCVIQGGISFNQYFTTYTSWIALPKLAFIPFHKCTETYSNSSEMHTNTQEILSFQQKTKAAYADDIKNDTLNKKTLDKVNKVINLKTTKIPDYGVIEYKNLLNIKGEYWMEKPKYLIDTQFIKVGLPNILKFLRVALDSLPYNIPAYFYSQKTGGMTKPWIAKRLLNANDSSDTAQETVGTMQNYTLNKFQYYVTSDNSKIIFDIQLISSLFGLYSFGDDNSDETMGKTDKTNENASETGVG